MLIKNSLAAPLNAQVLILTRFALGPAGPVQFRS
jgi:hypothetical protein